MNLEHGLTFFTILLSQLVDKGTPGISILVWLALVLVGVYSSYSLLIVVSDANVTSVVCKSYNNTWLANCPFRGAQLDCNEVGPKELCRRLGAQPLNTTSVCSRSTAPQPDELDWESILEWMKTGVSVENPRSQVKIDLNSTQLKSHTTFVGKVEGVIDVHYASLTFQGVQWIYPDGHPSTYQPRPTGLDFGE